MSSLSTYHIQQMERLGSDFFEDGDGLRAVARRTEFVDDIVRGHFDGAFASQGNGIAAVAVGGYGRSELFPFSDIDLLLLFRRARDVEEHRDRIAGLIASLWDSKLRVSHSVRDPAECARLAPNNTELHISLLDTRFVAGDAGFFDEFRRNTLPRFYLREQKALIRSLAETAQKRHRSFDGTLYHLEPDIKEGPGGLRDYHLACWTAQLENVQPGRIPRSEEFLPRQRDWDIGEAKRFLFALRCFLHYYHGRDKNLLSYDMQETIAHAGAGHLYPGEGSVADMMRIFFKNTRLVHRLALRLVEESTAPSNALLTMFRRRISRLSNSDFSVTNGKIYFQDPNALATRPELSLRIFQFQARHGLPLAAQAELRIREHLASVRAHFAASASHWPSVREILLLPHAYRALGAMRESGVLYSLFPEFELVDCLVIRDFYHRYTVDEHTLVTIHVLKDLPTASDPLDQRYARLLNEVERADLLYFAILFHDLGKGVPGKHHHEASAQLADEAMSRIGLADSADRETVLYLVRDHLTMSEVMTKRDLSETAVLEDFKVEVGTVERLKLLTLLTYADSVAVNPTAVTSWRKELLWRLYCGTDAIFQRDHEDKRIEEGASTKCLELATDTDERRRMSEFLAGFPQRYLRTHEAPQVYKHFKIAEALRERKATVKAERTEGHWDIVVLAWDRPFLFASLCAAIASFNLNIEHAEAFSNEAGMVLDSFRVSTGADGPGPAQDRLELKLRRVAEGRVDPGDLAQARTTRPVRRRGHTPPHVSFDNGTSAKATIFYVQAPDRNKLLFDLAIVFSQHECNIDVVLCNTQGHQATDVFYVRHGQGKLPHDKCESLREELLESCSK